MNLTQILVFYFRFLRFFYTAEIQIASENVVGLVYLADKYNVNALRELTQQFMMHNACSPHVRNAIDWYAVAKTFGLAPLVELCVRTVSWNVEMLIGGGSTPKSCCAMRTTHIALQP